MFVSGRISQGFNQKGEIMKTCTKASLQSKSVTIAEILHLAADKYLAAKSSEFWYNRGTKEKYSCCAVSEAARCLWNEDKIDSLEDRNELLNRAFKGLEAMGCPINSSDAFDEANVFNPESQQARYAWLKFAAMIAEEQGV